MHLPNFIRRRERAEIVKFAPVRQVFEPQIGVVPNRDLNGWVDERRRIKWSMKHGQKYYINAKKAREFEAKGYLTITDGRVTPVSEDEYAEIMSTVTTIGLKSLETLNG